MTLIPVQTWYDTETGHVFQKSLACTEDGRPMYASYRDGRANAPHWGTPGENSWGQDEFPTEIMKDESGNSLGLLPTRSNITDAGLDFYSAEDVTLQPNLHPEVVNITDSKDSHRVLVRTGIKMQIPEGTGLFLWDRSGMSARDGIHRVAGVLDADYRGELKVALINLSNKVYHIKKGDKIIQGILAPIILAKPVQVASLSETARGAGGFGSTGV
jgi:dUTP pyrophosphatase